MFSNCLNSLSSIFKGSNHPICVSWSYKNANSTTTTATTTTTTTTFTVILVTLLIMSRLNITTKDSDWRIIPCRQPCSRLRVPTRIKRYSRSTESSFIKNALPKKLSEIPFARVFDQSFDDTNNSELMRIYSGTQRGLDNASVALQSRALSDCRWKSQKKSKLKL